MKKQNKLLNRKNLISLIKSAGIKRVNKESIDLLETHFTKELENLAKILKVEVTVNARKTLRKEDVKRIITNINSQHNY